MPCIYTFTEKNDLRNLTLKKSLERFIRKYIPDVRFEYHKRNPLITTVVDGSIFFFMRMKSFLNYFALKMILVNILQNFAIYLLFCFAHYDNFSKWYIFLLQDKLNFFVLHNFKKWFSKTTVNQIVNDNWLVFWVCYFGSTKKWCLQNLCLIKKWMIVDIVDKNVFEIISLSNNLVLACQF